MPMPLCPERCPEDARAMHYELACALRHLSNAMNSRIWDVRWSDRKEMVEDAITLILTASDPFAPGEHRRA